MENELYERISKIERDLVEIKTNQKADFSMVKYYLHEITLPYDDPAAYNINNLYRVIKFIPDDSSVDYISVMYHDLEGISYFGLVGHDTFNAQNRWAIQKGYGANTKAIVVATTPGKVIIE